MKQRRGIRGIVIRAGIFLLLGAIVNIAVAWGCALFSPFGESSVESRPASHEVDTSVLAWWTDSCPFPEGASTLARCYPQDRLGDAYREERITLWSITVVGLAAQVGGFAVEATGGRMHISASRILTGLPMKSMCAERWFKWENQEAAPSEEVLRGLRVQTISIWHMQDQLTWLLDGRYLPLRVVWPGFAINTLFYAAILWLLFAAPFALRRKRRIKRGLCPACAYPVGTSDLCTECGMPVTRRPRGRALERQSAAK